MKKIYLIASLMISSMAFATDYTVDLAIQKAYENNLEINRALKDVEIKEIDYKKTVKQLYPKLSFSSSLLKLSDDYYTSRGYNVHTDTSYTNKLVIQQPVFVGGAVLNGIKVLKYGETVANIQYEQKKREIKLNVVQAYSNILKIQENKEILENALEELTKTYDVLKQKYDLDLITKKPLLDLNYRILEIKSNLLTTNNEIEIKKLALKNILGLPKNEDINLLDLDSSIVKFNNINLDSDIAFAKTNKSSLKSLEVSKNISEISKNSKKSELLPKIYFTANYETKGKESGKDTSGTWTAGLITSMNLFDFGATFDDMSKSKKEIEQKIIDIELAKDKIELAIRSNYLELQRNDNLLEIKEQALESSKENYRVEKERLDLDMTIISEFLNSENDYRRAQIELINAKVDLYLSYVKYLDIVEREEK